MSYDVKQLVVKYLENIAPNISLGEALAIVRSKIAMAESIVETMEANFKSWGIGAFVHCPHCGSKTLLEFGACHWCDHHLLDQTHEAPKKELPAPVVAETKKNEQVQMGDEPPATINWEGKASAEVKEEAPKRTRKAKAEDVVAEASAKEEPVISKEEKLSIITDMIEEAKKAESGVPELKKINELAGLGIDVRACGKLSIFRKAVIDGLTAMSLHFAKAEEKEEVKVEEEVVEVVEEKPKAKKERAPRKKKEKAPKKEEVADPDFDDEEMEEVASPYKEPVKEKGPKVIEVSDEDFEDAEELSEEVEDFNLDEDDDISAISLDDLDVEDLSDEDFDLDDE